MAHYLVYFPGATGASDDLFRSAGLGDLLGPPAGDLSPSFADVLHGGPDGGAGVVATWLDTNAPHRNPRLTICRAGELAQTWTTLRSGRAWFGVENSRPPTPRDLVRRRTFTGLPVRLRDGHDWLVPVARQLPHIRDVDDDGQETRRVARDYADFYERAAEFYALTAHLDLAEATAAGGVTYPGGMQFIADSLGMNYRVNLDVVRCLDLIGDEEYLPVIGATFELQTRLALDDLKKNAASCGIPAG